MAPADRGQLVAWVRVGSNLNQVTCLAHIEAHQGWVDSAGLGGWWR